MRSCAEAVCASLKSFDTVQTSSACGRQNRRGCLSTTNIKMLLLHVQEVTDSIWALLSSATWMRQYEACAAGGQAYYTALLYRKSAVTSAQPFSLHHYRNSVMGDAPSSPAHVARAAFGSFAVAAANACLQWSNSLLLSHVCLWDTCEHIAGL